MLSTDPAHSLADSYGTDLGDHPIELAPGLWGQQLDTQARMEDAWIDIQTWLLAVFEWAGVAAIEAEELTVIPGLDEIFALGDIKAYADSGEWDVVVVDCAPTAETHGTNRRARASRAPAAPLARSSAAVRKPRAQRGTSVTARAGASTATR